MDLFNWKLASPLSLLFSHDLLVPLLRFPLPSSVAWHWESQEIAEKFLVSSLFLLLPSLFSLEKVETGILLWSTCTHTLTMRKQISSESMWVAYIMSAAAVAGSPSAFFFLRVGQPAAKREKHEFSLVMVVCSLFIWEAEKGSSSVGIVVAVLPSSKEHKMSIDSHRTVQLSLYWEIFLQQGADQKEQFALALSLSSSSSSTTFSLQALFVYLKNKRKVSLLCRPGEYTVPFLMCCGGCCFVVCFSTLFFWTNP